MITVAVEKGKTMSDDVIRREDALKAVNDMTELEDDYLRCTNAINRIPSVDLAVIEAEAYTRGIDSERKRIANSWCKAEYDRGYKDGRESADRKGKWALDPNGMDWNIPAWRCSACGFVANYIGVQANGLGSNPMNWAGSKYCPNCGCLMKGADDE